MCCSGLQSNLPVGRLGCPADLRRHSSTNAFRRRSSSGFPEVRFIIFLLIWTAAGAQRPKNVWQQSFYADVLKVWCILQSTLVGKVKLLLTPLFATWTKGVVIVEICWHVNLDAKNECWDLFMLCYYEVFNTQKAIETCFLFKSPKYQGISSDECIYCGRICAHFRGMLTNVDLHFEGEKRGNLCNVRRYRPSRRAHSW